MSTPRLRITLAWYVIVLVLVAISERPWAHVPSGETARIAGLLLMAGAALGRVWVSAFIAGSKDQRLVTTGPYALCRHPLYALSLLGGIGVEDLRRKTGEKEVFRNQPREERLA